MLPSITSSRSLLPWIGAVLLSASVAEAHVQSDEPEVFPGNNEISLHLGAQAGLLGYNVGGLNAGGPATGARLMFDYAHALRRRDVLSVWLDFGLAFTFDGSPGVDCHDGVCAYAPVGVELSPFAGVKLKWRTPIPLVPYAKLGAQLTGIVNRACGDDGVGVLGHAAGGATWFLTRYVGLGLETGFSAGPALYSGTNGTCGAYAYGAHVEVYAAADVTANVQFIF